jgi:hypothetical protein
MSYKCPVSLQQLFADITYYNFLRVRASGVRNRDLQSGKIAAEKVPLHAYLLSIDAAIRESLEQHAGLDPYTHEAIDWSAPIIGKPTQSSAPSIDHEDPSEGRSSPLEFTPKFRITRVDTNQMKGSMTHTEFLNKVRRIADRQFGSVHPCAENELIPLVRCESAT